MTMTAPAPFELDLPDDTIRATLEEITAATNAGKAARREGRRPSLDPTIDALIGERTHLTAHRTRDLLQAWHRGYQSAAPKHRKEMPVETAEETGRNLMPVVVLLALASIPTAAVIAAVSYIA